MIKPPFSKLVLALSTVLALPALPAYSGTYGESGMSAESAAEYELNRRETYVANAQEAIAAGDEAMKVKDYEAAFAQYRLALDLLPDSPETVSLRTVAKIRFCDAGVRLAEQRISEGRYADAETLLKLMLEDRYDPDCDAAKGLLAQLNTPGYYNKAITPGFIGKVEEVKKLLLEADQFYRTGRYDLAMKRYDQVLNIDPYNIAARKGQEVVNQTRSNYASDAYNEARSRLLWEVDKSWQSRVRNYKASETGPLSTGAEEVADNQALLNKLSRIIIPQIQFRDASVREAIEFLKQKSVELDTTEPDPAKRGVNIVLKLESNAAYQPAGAAEAAIPGVEGAPAEAAAPAINPSEARITLSLRNIPMIEALNYIANLAGLKVKVDPYAVAIVPQSEPTDVLVTKEYRVPPGFIPNVQSEGGGGASPFGGGGTEPGGVALGAGGGISQRAAAREFLEAQGVQFPAGASANFLPSSSRLIVRNTQPNIDLIDTLVSAVMQGPGVSQVEIETKFVEVSQNNRNELGFDWLLGQANIPGGSESVFYGGGTTGFEPPLNAANYPFNNPATGPVGNYPLTAGNRSGNTAIPNNAINSLLANVPGLTDVAPGIFSLAGVFTDPQFQLVIRALNQKKGIDLLSAPRVTTKSGQRAVIEIIRELRYPTEFDPPQIPQNVGINNQNNNVTVLTPLGFQATQGSTNPSFPVTPTTPTAFETRNTGVTLEVEPVVGPDGYTIDLNLAPQVVEFEGFINYGSPIQTTGLDGLGNPITNILTDNVINQPVFSTRKVTTSVSIWDGQTIVLGGLIREDVQKVEDKLPLLGDLPIVGRLFRSQVDQSFKRNLVIFVTARLMNPAGEPILEQGEEDEVMEMLAPPEITPPVLPEAPLFGK